MRQGEKSGFEGKTCLSDIVKMKAESCSLSHFQVE